MKLQLADGIGILTIAVTLLTFLVTREKFVQFWKKWFKLVLAVIVLIVLWLLWNQGWFDWLQDQVSLPIWGLILYSVFLVLVPTGISRLRHTRKPTQCYYSCHGVLWPLHEGQACSPPQCSPCCIEMLCVSMPKPYAILPDDRFEVWKCRSCMREITWDSGTKGDLLEDVNAHYRGALRRAE